MKFSRFLLIARLLFHSGLNLASPGGSGEDGSNIPQDAVSLIFADGFVLKTTYSIICRPKTHCFFTPYAQGTFSPSAYSNFYGTPVPVIFLPSIRWEIFQPIFDALALQMSLESPPPSVQAVLEYLGYRAYFFPPEADKIVTFEVNGATFEFAAIPGGRYTMGSPSDEVGRYDHERQQRTVDVAPFFMQSTQVTQAQWRAVKNDNPSTFRGDDLPVESVSYVMVQEFIGLLNERLREQDLPGVSLPTE